MKNSLRKRIICLAIVLGLVIEVLATPYRAFAFDENAINLNIDTTSIEVKNAWAQIKNAAVIHLVASKMYRCVEGGHVLDGNRVLPRKSGWVWWAVPPVYAKGVVDKGSVFNWSAMGVDLHNNIYVGPWMSNLFKANKTGEIECNDWTGNDGNLFNMFVYILKNYKAGMNISDLENASVNESDRMRVICNKDNPAHLGLLAPADKDGSITNEACNDPNVSYYTGVGVANQLSYLGELYEEMRSNSGNKYILEWGDALHYYDEVDGYYLYSNDFSTQCSGATFEESPSGIDFKVGNSSGKVSRGYWRVSGNTAAYSFVSTDKKSCQDLVNDMRRTIPAYLRKVNFEVYKACKAGVDEAIEDKRKEINEKYINNDNVAEAEKEDAQLVLDEYRRVQSENEYVATNDEDGGETLYQLSDSAEVEWAMPTDLVWTCRAHLPFIDVVIQREDDLADILEDEFYDACYDAIDLAWVLCPIINGLSGITDALNSMIEDFF